jgi:aminoglycoside phosphotransferase family enzyme/predicted kinase
MQAACASASPPGTDLLVQGLRGHLALRTGRPVELVQTHISWVLLTERLAFKLKKPVRLPFLDFSTPALRQHFCEEELRLNRRMAPQLYLALLPVRGSAQAPRLGGAGEPIDHLVCMRRFPADALLGERVRSGRVLPQHIDRLGLAVAKLHAAAPRLPAQAAFGTPARVLGPVLQVLRQLPALRPLWRTRRAGGFVRECHGDLHLGNAVVIGEEVTPFDCIEFDPAMRWIDVMNDLAFATMDLKAHGRADLAHRLLDSYLEASGDHAGVRVLHWYELYRALVRALVQRLSPGAGQHARAAKAPDYLACALDLVREPAAPGPRLLITHGLSGSGKSHIAGRLLERAGAVRLRSDVERKRLFGLGPLQRSAGGPVDIYTPQATRQTFERLLQGARQGLLAGWPVIVDAAFLRHAERAAFQALAAELGVPYTVLHCRADPALLRRRVARRLAEGGDPSEADLPVLERQLGYQEPLDAQELRHTVEVDTDGVVDLDGLCDRWLAPRPPSPGLGKIK